LNKKELIDAVAARLDGNRKSAVTAVEGVLDEITRALVKGDRVQITGFGTFEKRARPARTARNPRTGETIKVKKTSAPAFKAGATLKSVVSGATKLPRATAAKAPATKAAPAKKAAAKKAAPARKVVAKKVAAKKAAPARKAPAKKAAAKRTAR
jgi:DNA-binding protein HU-beta